MPNKPPFAIGTVSKTQIKFPENQVTIDMSGSWDPNKKAVLTVTFYQKTGPVGTVFTPGTAPHAALFGNSPVSNVKFATPGTFVLVGRVTDKGGITNEKEFTVTVLPTDVVKTKFGASGDTIDGPATLRAVCGWPSVTRTAKYFGDMSANDSMKSNELEMYLNADCDIFYNLNWKHPIRDAQGNKIPIPFPTGTTLTQYFSALEKALAYYENHPKKDLIKCVCFNEPTTRKFHSGPMSDYGIVLKGFVQRCVRYGYKYMSDGGVHVGTILGADDPDGQGLSAQVAQLLDIYASIPELTRINCHTNGGSTFDSNSVVRADQKAFSITGRHLWSNEWHATDAQGVVKIAQGWFDAGVPFSVYITGTDPGYELNNGTNLTAFGEAYKKFIDAHR